VTQNSSASTTPPTITIDYVATDAWGKTPTSSRTVIVEAAKAAFNSSAYKEAKKVGDKYAKFRVYAVEGLSA
jgi:hypothetical protein